MSVKIASGKGRYYEFDNDVFNMMMKSVERKLSAIAFPAQFLIHVLQNPRHHIHVAYTSGFCYQKFYVLKLDNTEICDIHAGKSGRCFSLIVEEDKKMTCCCSLAGTDACSTCVNAKNFPVVFSSSSNAPVGWICPLCGGINSPYVEKCPCNDRSLSKLG